MTNLQPNSVQSRVDVIMPPRLDEGRSLCVMLSDATSNTSIATSVGRKIRQLALVGSGLKDASSVTADKGSESSGPMVGGSLPSSCSLEDKEKLSQSLEVLVNYATLFGFRSERFDRTTTLSHWQLCAKDCGWLKFLKYKLAAFMAYHLDNSLPEKPFSSSDLPNQLAGHTLGRFIQRFAVDDPDLQMSFVVGILYSKKGMPRPTDLACEQAKMKTKEVLTTKQIAHTSPFSSTAVIAEEVRRTCKEVFSQRLSERDLHHPYAPSVKANYVAARSSFGTFGTLMDENFILNQFDPDLAEYIYGTALEIDDDAGGLEKDTVHLKVTPQFRQRVKTVYRDVYENVRLRARDEVADVTLVALPEALKVRTISKGPPLTYFVLKPVQKFLHRTLRRLRCFRLLGETVTPRYLSEVFAQSEGLFHSLDYQSATDLLDPELSGVCVEGICDAVGMPYDLRDLFHKALTGHLVEGLPQLWGQLMGSVVSFIVLCTINLAVVRHAYELTLNTRVSVVEIPAIINGDDGLVRAPREFSKIWESVAAVAGLIPSLGKTYTDEEYVNINSTSFLFENPKFVHIPYANMGLVYGLGRSGQSKVADVAVEVGPYLSSLGLRHHALLEMCPESMRLKVHEQFLLRNADALKSVRVPWYIPESLGGMGLKPLVSYDYGDGDVDSIRRRYFRTSTGHRCGPSRTDVTIASVFRDRGYRTISVGRIPSQQPIRSRPVWQSVVRRQWGGGRSVQLSEADEVFMDLACYYLTPSLVAVELDKETRVSMVRRNERAWSYLYAQMGTYLDKGDDLFLD